jgi:hypothetical protein
MTLKVCIERCNQCLFGPTPIVGPERIKQVLNKCEREGAHFICHKTDDTVCKGFYDTSTSQGIRIARRLDMVEFV